MSSAGEQAAPVERRGVRLVLLIIVALVAAWFSLRHALLGALQRDYPLLGLSLTPPSPVSAGIVALNRVGRDGVADVRTRLFIEQSARGAPLAAEPFIAAGLDANARDRPDQAFRLFQQARLRDPRSIATRYWLFDYYLRTGRFADGIDEAQPLLRLQPAVTPAVTSLLTALLDVPEARGILLDRLRRNPPWRGEFLRQVAATPRLRAEVGALLLTSGAQAGGSVRDQEGIIGSLLRGGDVDGAWASWLATLPAQARQRAVRGAIYDGSFAGLPGAPPFNWRLARVGVSAGTDPSGSGTTMLRIAVIPRREIILAEQTVLTRAGRHRLSFTTQAVDEQPSAATLEAQIRCAGQRSPVATRQLEELGGRLTPIALDADLPQGCRAVQIRFIARPGIAPGGLSAQVSSVKFAPAN